MQEPIARHRSLLILCSVLSLVAGGVIGFFTPHPRGPALTVVTPDPTPTPEPLRVYVSGAVVAPAVYRLQPRSLVEDAVRAAGGALDTADLARINLAQELVDQQHVHVPALNQAAGPIETTGAVPAPALIDINTASAQELETLPNIGPATATRIIEFRQTYGPFATIAEIMDVPGIGPATFERIRDQITVGAPP